MAKQPQGLGVGLFQRPLASGSSAALAGGLEQHGQTHGGQQIEQPREAFGVMQLASLELDEVPQQQRQQAAKGVYADF